MRHGRITTSSGLEHSQKRSKHIFYKIYIYRIVEVKEYDIQEEDDGDDNDGGNDDDDWQWLWRSRDHLHTVSTQQ